MDAFCYVTQLRTALLWCRRLSTGGSQSAFIIGPSQKKGLSKFLCCLCLYQLKIGLFYICIITIPVAAEVKLPGKDDDLNFTNIQQPETNSLFKI